MESVSAGKKAKRKEGGGKADGKEVGKRKTVWIMKGKIVKPSHVHRICRYFPTLFHMLFFGTIQQNWSVCLRPARLQHPTTSRYPLRFLSRDRPPGINGSRGQRPTLYQNQPQPQRQVRANQTAKGGPNLIFLMRSCCNSCSGGSVASPWLPDPRKHSQPHPAGRPKTLSPYYRVRRR